MCSNVLLLAIQSLLHLCTSRHAPTTIPGILPGSIVPSISQVQFIILVLIRLRLWGIGFAPYLIRQDLLLPAMPLLQLAGNDLPAVPGGVVSKQKSILIPNLSLNMSQFIQAVLCYAMLCYVYAMLCISCIYAAYTMPNYNTSN